MNIIPLMTTSRFLVFDYSTRTRTLTLRGMN